MGDDESGTGFVESLSLTGDFSHRDAERDAAQQPWESIPEGFRTPSEVSRGGSRISRTSSGRSATQRSGRSARRVAREEDNRWNAQRAMENEEGRPVEYPRRNFQERNPLGGARTAAARIGYAWGRSGRVLAAEDRRTPSVRDHLETPGDEQQPLGEGTSRSRGRKKTPQVTPKKRASPRREVEPETQQVLWESSDLREAWKEKQEREKTWPHEESKASHGGLPRIQPEYVGPGKGF